MGSRGNLRKARFYCVLRAEENHRAETGGGVAAAVGCSGGDGISRHEKKLGLLIAGRGRELFAIRGPRADWTFIPKGDMPRWTCVILEVLDRVGRMWRLVACPGSHSYRHQRRLTTLSIPH